MTSVDVHLDKPATKAPPGASSAMLQEVAQITQQRLAGMVSEIDKDGAYPEDILTALGAAGAYRTHLPLAGQGEPDLQTAIAAMQIAGERCLSTSFCMWCQDALGWYIYNSDNSWAQEQLGERVAAGDVLGGTGLSNPMKCFAGIERLRLKGKRHKGGYLVKGMLPWISNLGEGHYFGAVFALEDDPEHFVMAVIDCSAEGVKLTENDQFVALNGTRTFGVQFRDVFIPDQMILADPIDAYILRIRAGFVLLQAGMAFGVIQSSIDLMKQMRGPLEHVNKYLDQQPEYFEDHLAAMQEEVATLSATPFDTSDAYWRRVLEARLAAGELSVQAAHAAMLHCGARGYVSTGEAQRRLRESYFVAIVTPATKQLRKMLAEMPS